MNLDRSDEHTGDAGVIARIGKVHRRCATHTHAVGVRVGVVDVPVDSPRVSEAFDPDLSGITVADDARRPRPAVDPAVSTRAAKHAGHRRGRSPYPERLFREPEDAHRIAGAALASRARVRAEADNAGTPSLTAPGG